MTVTVDNVAVGLGRSSSDMSILEREQIDQWLADARLLIQSRLGDLALLDQDILDYVVREAVVAKATNPNPDPGGSEQIDDYVRRWGPSPVKSVYILDEWWNMLDPDTGSVAFSVRPSFETDTDRWPTSQGEGTYTIAPDGWHFQ